MVIRCLASLCMDCINTVDRNYIWRRRPYRKQTGQSSLLWSKCLEDDPLFISLTFITVIKYKHLFSVIQRVDLAALLENSIGSLRYNRNVGGCFRREYSPPQHSKKLRKRHYCICVHQFSSVSSAFNANKADKSWEVGISRGYINLS